MLMDSGDKSGQDPCLVKLTFYPGIQTINQCTKKYIKEVQSIVTAKKELNKIQKIWRSN